MKLIISLSILVLIVLLIFIFLKWDQKRNPWNSRVLENFKIPKTIIVKRDIAYATYGSREVLLDLYLPAKSISKKIPCIVVIHGGAWQMHDKNFFAPHAAYFAENGFAAVSIDYRLIPEVTLKQCVEDAKASVRWIRANADQFGIDENRIGAFGGSAGGHLAALLGTSFKVPELEGIGANPMISSKVQAVVALAAPFDLTINDWYKKIDLTKEDAEILSPVSHFAKDSSPFLLMHCAADSTVPVDMSQMTKSKLEEIGVPVKFIQIEDGPHAFWNRTMFFDEVMAKCLKFFKEAFGDNY